MARRDESAWHINALPMHALMSTVPRARVQARAAAQELSKLQADLAAAQAARDKTAEELE